MKTRFQSGNVFFLILAAVAMFAALAWVFTQNSRQSSGSLTSEQSRIGAQEFIAFGNTTADTMQKLKLRGCAQNQFDFANTVWTLHDGTTYTVPAGTNPTAATGCGVFKAGEGSAIAAIMPRSSMFDWTSIAAVNTEVGHGRIQVYNVPGIGTTAEDLVLTFPTVSLSVCQKINEILGITNPVNDVPNMTLSFTGCAYVGTFGSACNITDNTGYITGKTAFCARSSASPQDNRFMQVLYTR